MLMKPSVEQPAGSVRINNNMRCMNNNRTGTTITEYEGKLCRGQQMFYDWILFSEHWNLRGLILHNWFTAFVHCSLELSFCDVLLLWCLYSMQMYCAVRAVSQTANKRMAIIGQSSAVASVLREDYNVFVLLEILNFSDRLSPPNDDIHSSI